MERAGVASDLGQYLTFFIAGEEYAVGILRAREIVEYGTITKVPAVPACIRGVINLRGSVVPVIDLAIKFDFGECKITKWSCIVIVEVELDGEPTVMGILVDAIGQVVDLLPEDIAPPPGFGTRMRVDYLDGMGTMGKKFVLILNVDLVLSVVELLASAALGGNDPSLPDARTSDDAGPPGLPEPEAGGAPREVDSGW